MSKNISEAIAAMEEVETSTAAATEEATSEDSSEASDHEDAPTGEHEVAETTEAATPEAEETQEADEATLRRQALQERLEAAKAKSRSARDQQKLRAEREELERSKQEVVKFHEQLKRQAHEIEQARSEVQGFVAKLRKTPVAALRDVGVDPALAYEAITNEMLQRESPLSKEDELLEKLQKTVGPKLSKVEELEKRLEQYEQWARQREQMEAASSRNSATANFLNVVRKNGYEDLADYYEDDQLVQLGDFVANEFVDAGRKFTFDDVAAELTERLKAHLKRGEERRNQRTAGSQSAAAQPATKSPLPSVGVTAKKPASAIGNDLASASATSAPSSRPKSRKEILAAAARDIETADILSMIR